MSSNDVPFDVFEIHFKKNPDHSTNEPEKGNILELASHVGIMQSDHPCEPDALLLVMNKYNVAQVTCTIPKGEREDKIASKHPRTMVDALPTILEVFYHLENYYPGKYQQVIAELEFCYSILRVPWMDAAVESLFKSINMAYGSGGPYEIPVRRRNPPLSQVVHR